MPAGSRGHCNTSSSLSAGVGFPVGSVLVAAGSLSGRVLSVANFEFDDHALLVAEWPAANREWWRFCDTGRGNDHPRYRFRVGALWEPIQCDVGAGCLEPDTPYGLRTGSSVEASSKAVHHHIQPYVGGIEGYDLFDRPSGIFICDPDDDQRVVLRLRTIEQLKSVSNVEFRIEAGEAVVKCFDLDGCQLSLNNHGRGRCGFYGRCRRCFGDRGR